MQVAINAGIKGAVVLSKVQALCKEKGFGHGWNAATGEYCNLFDAGVIDPAKVTINALENSASVAGLVLTTEALVTEIPVFLSETEKQDQFDQMGSMEGYNM